MSSAQVLAILFDVITAYAILQAAFHLKHFLADYPLQNSYMLGKFKEKGWELPLAAHAGVHAAFTHLICCAFLIYAFGKKPGGSDAYAWWAFGLTAFDFGVHFIVDRIKASPKMLGRFKALSGPEYMAVSSQLKIAEGTLEECEREGRPTWPAKLTIRNNKEKLSGNTYFWWALGADQAAHNYTHDVICFTLMFIYIQSLV